LAQVHKRATLRGFPKPRPENPRARGRRGRCPGGGVFGTTSSPNVWGREAGTPPSTWYAVMRGLTGRKWGCARRSGGEGRDKEAIAGGGARTQGGARAFWECSEVWRGFELKLGVHQKTCSGWWVRRRPSGSTPWTTWRPWRLPRSPASTRTQGRIPDRPPNPRLHPEPGSTTGRQPDPAPLGRGGIKGALAGKRVHWQRQCTIALAMGRCIANEMMRRSDFGAFSREGGWRY